MATQDELQNAQNNLRTCINGRPLGNGSLVKVNSFDIVAAASSVTTPTKITVDLHRGSLPHHQYTDNVKRQSVFVKVDDVKHLLEQPAAASGKPVIPSEDPPTPVPASPAEPASPAPVVNPPAPAAPVIPPVEMPTPAPASPPVVAPVAAPVVAPVTPAP